MYFVFDFIHVYSNTVYYIIAHYGQTMHIVLVPYIENIIFTSQIIARVFVFFNDIHVMNVR